MTKSGSKVEQPMMATSRIFSELHDTASSRIETMMDVQRELMDSFEGINNKLVDHLKKEVELTSEFVGKFTGVRSVSDATTTYWEWVAKEMELLAADGRQMLVHGEKVMESSHRLFGNGRQSAGS